MPSMIINPLGKIHIVDDVVATIAGCAAVETYGIVGMTAKTASDGLQNLFGIDNIKKGVKVTTNEGAVDIDLHVVVEYGVSIIAVANSALENVHFKVSEMTGLPVNSVNVAVDGVRVNEN